MTRLTGDGSEFDMQPHRAILVTGASTGIGRAITEQLAADGHLVYAGARKESDLKSLETVKNVYPLRLDVTSPREIDSAVVTVRTREAELCGLVNNAGVATIGSVLETSENEFDLIMAVNVCGVYKVTRAFAPLIAASHGRIVMLGSISGILADGNVCAYSMSKHAIEAFGDSLAIEMAPLGVSVSVIEPGVFKTKLLENALKRLGCNSDLSMESEQGPEAVISAIKHALFSPIPKRRYLVVSRSEDARRVLEKQISQLTQLNEAHQFSLPDDAILKMLGDALSG